MGFPNVIVSNQDYSQSKKAKLNDFSHHDYETKITYVYPQGAIFHNGYTHTVPHFVSQAIKDVHFSKGVRFWSHPLRAIPLRLPSAFYVDIKSAYRQIASVWGAETIWKEDKPVAFGMYDFSDSIFDQKLARGLIVSLTHETKTTRMWDGSKVTAERSTNFRNAPNLHNAIMGTLHQIFFECGGVPYIHTDGMIVPDFMMQKVTSVLDKWDVVYGIKDQGECRIFGTGCYGFNGKLPVRINHQKSNKIDDVYRPSIFKLWKMGKE